jgi:hypothetical protein
MLAWWTLRRASGAGAGAGGLALLLWPFYGLYPDRLEWPFVALAVIAGLCGASILMISVRDVVRVRRGRRVRALRGFDFALGSVLVALSVIQIQDVQRHWMP